MGAAARRLRNAGLATIAGLVGLMLMPSVASAAWNQPVGGESPINHASNQGGFVANVTSIGGVPYVAWTEFDGTNFEIRVSRLNGPGTAWEQVVGGASPINNDTTWDASQASLTSIGGVPYVAWNEFDGANDEIRVAAWSPNSWVRARRRTPPAPV
jgi:hypothetical protein